MKLSFTIDYETHWGESIHISGNVAELGNGKEENALGMTYDGRCWRAVVDV